MFVDDDDDDIMSFYQSKKKKKNSQSGVSAVAKRLTSRDVGCYPTLEIEF
jgi:hypothetical protein